MEVREKSNKKKEKYYIIEQRQGWRMRCMRVLKDEYNLGNRECDFQLNWLVKLAETAKNALKMCKFLHHFAIMWGIFTSLLNKGCKFFTLLWQSNVKFYFLLKRGKFFTSL